MYSDSDFDVAAKRSQTALIFGIVLICAFLALVIALIALEMEVLTLICAGLGFIVCYFLWSFKVMPWIHYGKYMKELRNGRRRQMECQFGQISDETRMFDNIEVRDVLVSVGDEEEDERIMVTSFGNFITDVVAITPPDGTQKIDLNKQ